MLNILLIEDVFGMSGEVKELMASAGYAVSESLGFSDEAAILACIVKKKIDLVISNILLQKETTAERLLRKISQLDDTVQVLLTGQIHSIEFTRIVITCGAACYLCLPEENELMHTALLLFEQRREASRLSQQKSRKEIFIKYLEEEGELNSYEIKKLFSGCAEDDLYQAAVVRILPPYRKRYHRNDDNLIILKGIELLNCQFEKNQKCLIVKRGIDLWTLLWGTEKELEEGRLQFKKFLSDIKEMNYACFKVAAWVALGPVAAKNTEIYKSCRMAAGLLRERIIKGSIGFFECNSYPGLSCDKKEPGFLTFGIRRTLLNALEMFDEESIHRILMQLRQNIITTSNSTGADLYRIYKEIMAVLFMELDKLGADTSEPRITYESALKEYDYYWNVEDVFESMYYYMREGIRALRKQKEDSEPAVIVRAKQYIRDFFSMPLTLKEVSSYVGMSEAYFSDYFRKHTNQTFKQYITDIRMKYAKQMLLDGNVSLEDIAETVGYNDKKYFSRVFKNETGYTPGEYRRDYWPSVRS